MGGGRRGGGGELVKHEGHRAGLSGLKRKKKKKRPSTMTYVTSNGAISDMSIRAWCCLIQTSSPSGHCMNREREREKGFFERLWFGHVSGHRAADNGRSLGRYGHSRDVYIYLFTGSASSREEGEIN